MDNLHIPITGDNTGFVRALNDARERVRSTARDIERSGMSIEDMFARIKQAANSSLGVNFEESFGKAKKVMGELRKIIGEGIDLSNPKGELQKFDTQVLALSKHLDDYFESLKVKLNDLLGVANMGKSYAEKIPSGDNNSAQLEQVRRQNEELEEQIKRQTEEIARQQEQWQKLAEAVRTNNVSAIQKLSQETDEATKRIKLDSLKGGLKALGGEMDMFAERMATASGNAEELKAELESLREQGAGDAQIASVEKEYQQAVEELEKLKSEYNSMSKEQKNYIDQLNEAEGHHVRMRTQIMDAREQLIQMIQAGQKGTPEFQELAQKAGEMRKEMEMANAIMQYYGTPNRHLAALKEGLQGAAGAAGVMVGIMGIFNEKSEKMAEIQTKLQSIIGVIVGLETTYNAVKKTSNVMIAVSEFQTWALARAKQAEASATALATARQAAYNLVAKANPYVLLASVVGALAVGIYRLVSANKEATESEKARQEEIEKTRKAEEHRLQTVGKHTGDLVSKYMLLQRQWAQLKTTGEKTKWLDTNIGKFKELTSGVTDVASAEEYLVGLAPQVIAALKAVAEADAYSDLYKEAIQKRAKEWENRVKSKKTGDFYEVEKGGWVDATASIPHEWYQAGLTTADYESKWVGQYSQKARLTKSGIDKINNYRIKQAQETRKKLEEEYNKDVDSYGDMYDKALKKAQDAKEKLGKYGLNGGNNNNNNPNGRDYEREQREFDKANARFNELQEKQDKANTRAAKDMEFSTTQATIDAMEEGTQKKAAQIMLDFAKQKEELKRGYEDLKQTKIDNARKLFDADPSNKNKVFDPSSVDTSYSEAEIENFRQLNEAADKEYSRHLREIQEEERRYRLDFLKEYGSYEEQRLAIAEEYDRKIAEADNEWARKSLEEQKKTAINEVKLAEAKFTIDWGAVFGRITSLSTRKLEEQKQALLSLANSGGITDINQIRELQEALSAIMDELASRHGGIFAMRTAYNDLKSAQKGVIDAEVKLTQARMAGSQEAIRASEKELTLAREREKTARKSVDSAKKATADFINAITDFDFTSFSGVFTGLKNVAPAFDAMFKTNIQGIFNELGDEMTAALGKLGDQIINTVQNITTLIDCSGGRDTYVQDMLEKFDALSDSIDNLAKKIEEGTIDEAIEAYEQQLAMLREQTSSSQTTLKAAMDMSEDNCNRMCGSEHNYNSVNQELGKRLTANDWNAIRSILGIGINSASQLWGLSPEQMYAIQTYLPNIMTKIKNAISSVGGQSDHGKTAADEALRTLENYIGLAGREEDLQVKIAFRVTGLSLDELRENFKSTLKDIKNDVEDFSDDVSETLANALLNAEFSKAGGINQKLEAWYDRLMQLFYNRSSMSSQDFNNQLSSLRTDYEKYAAEAIAARNWANELAGVDTIKYEQEASSKGFQTMSQSTADELNGRFTALQIAGEKVSENIIAMLERLNSMSDMASDRNELILEIRNMMETANGYLEDVAKYNKKIYDDFGEKLDKIHNKI